MNIKHAIVIKTDTEPMKVRVTEMEKPNEADERYISSWHKFMQDKYDADLSEWKSSFVEYPVGSEEDFEDLSRYDYLNNVGMLHLSWYDDIRVGIDVKVDKIAIESLCVQTGKPCGFPCNGQENCDKSKYAVVIKESVKTYITLQELLLQLSRNKSLSIECLVSDNKCRVVIKEWFTFREVDKIDIDLTKNLIDVEPFKTYM
jgi:hypothetical protein